MKTKLTIGLAIALTVSLLLYWGGFLGGIRMYSDPQAMRNEVLRKIPLGSRIEDAEQIMKENGFGCRLVKNEGFTEYADGDVHRPIEHEGQDFLSCGKRKMTWLLVTRDWSVIIVHQGGIVSEVYVNTGLTGP